MQCNIFFLTVIVAVLGGLTNRLYMHIHDNCCSIYTYVYMIHNSMYFTFGIILHIYSLFLLFFLHNIHVDVYIFQEGVSHSQLYLVGALSEIYWCTFVKSLNVCKKKSESSVLKWTSPISSRCETNPINHGPVSFCWFRSHFRETSSDNEIHTLDQTNLFKQGPCHLQDSKIL